MTKVTLLNTKGEKIEDIKLNDEIFGIEPNNKVLHDILCENLKIINEQKNIHNKNMTSNNSIKKYTKILIDSIRWE